MDIEERAAALADQIRKHKADIQTEEATKTAFVMPFIGSVLGYDVFNPTEVIPEFVADVGVKKGEKIDYAIVHDGQVQVLIEVKKIGIDLNFEHASQLFRYFAVTTARIAILTNGESYQFYTDLDAPNKMDSKPFLVLDFADIDETLLPDLAKLRKESFNLDSVLGSAEELKYIGALKRVLVGLFRQPADDWVKFLAARVYDGNVTARVREQFVPLVGKAMRQFLNEQATDRLKTALVTDEPPAEPVVATVDAPVPDGASDLVTTEEEHDGYRIVRAIVCSEVPVSRVFARDTKSYFGILLDDNNRKPIVRLWFNRTRKYLGLFDEHKVESRVAITEVEDIYQYADHLRKTVARYLDNVALANAPIEADEVAVSM
ncbi:MAG TPA: type I restriction endonuclease [Pseudonocardiaceae bacterium]|nr:type I restriction endonuclease [Pseudonocardiaceae bacterium]